MDALRIPAVEPRRANRDDEYSAVFDIDENSLAPRMKAAFVALLEALEYSQDLGANAWDFAVEIASLRSLELANSDLRWVVARGLAEHVVEITPVYDATRTFRHCERALFGKRSCFVLTPSGEALARELRGDSESDADHGELLFARQSDRDCKAPLRSRVPDWDCDRHELCIASVVVKRFTIPSLDAESVLTAFEEQSWPARIDDPLPPWDESAQTTRLQEAIHRLNRGQNRPGIRFLGDDTGRGVLWEYCSEATSTRRDTPRRTDSNC
jgi:hypothetical protein